MDMVLPIYPEDDAIRSSGPEQDVKGVHGKITVDSKMQGRQEDAQGSEKPGETPSAQLLHYQTCQKQ